MLKYIMWTHRSATTNNKLRKTFSLLGIDATM